MKQPQNYSTIQQREMDYNLNPSQLTFSYELPKQIQKSTKDSTYQLQNVEMEERANEIGIQIKLKSNEFEDRNEQMKIVIIYIVDKSQKVQIQITSPQDPLVLYILELSEAEFLQLKKEQSLLIDFQSFPNFLRQMLDLCINIKDQSFSCVLNKINQNDALFIIKERTQFRELNHLCLNVHQANDNIVKRYLGDLSMKFKKKYQDTFDALIEMKETCDGLSKDNKELNDKMQSLLIDKQNCLDNLTNEKNKEINEVKEKCFIEAKANLSQLEIAKNKTIGELEQKYAQLQKSYNILMQEKQKLDDYKLKLEMSHKDLEGKHAISNTELSVYKEDIANLRKDNSSLNQKCFQQEKELTELRLRNENLQKQNEEKEKGLQNLNILVDTLTKQRESNDDIVKSLKATNLKLEDKLHTSIGEINKGNDLIKRLENEIKSQKSKVKNQKQTLASQDQLINQKQILLDEQIRTVNDLKREIDTRDREITGLKHQISNYSVKLTENEKVIEDNKQMLMYMNKKMNDTISNPFKSRTNFGDNMRTSNNSYTRQQNVNYSSNYNNFNPDTNYQNQFQNYTGGLNTEQFNNLQSSSNANSHNSSGMMIMPETNFCNYKPGGRVAVNIDKYVNMPNTTGGNILSHKYGVVNMNLSNNNDMSGSSGIKGEGQLTYNIEEEFPRQMNEELMNK